MTKVLIYNDNENIAGFNIVGHSEYAMLGYDIVCAAISTASQMTVAGLTEVLVLPTHVEIDEQSGSLTCMLMTEEAIANEGAQVLMQTFKVAINDIANQYGNYVSISETQISEEVD